MGIAFLLTSLAVVATPGIGAVYTIAAGVSRGRRASLVAAVGCTVGVLPHTIAAITGLAAVLNTSAMAFQTIKYLGVVYLLYLAWQTWRDKTAALSTSQPAVTPPTSSWAVIRQAVLINLLNPKLTIFFFAFLPQFVQPGTSNEWLAMVGLSVVFMAITFVVFVGYGLFAAAVRTYVINRPAVLMWLRRTFAVSYVALAGRLALQDR